MFKQLFFKVFFFVLVSLSVPFSCYSMQDVAQIIQRCHTMNDLVKADDAVGLEALLIQPAYKEVIDIPDDQGATLVAIAAHTGKIAALEALIKHGASVYSKDKRGYTPYMRYADGAYNSVVYDVGEKAKCALLELKKQGLVGKALSDAFAEHYTQYKSCEERYVHGIQLFMIASLFEHGKWTKDPLKECPVTTLPIYGNTNYAMEQTTLAIPIEGSAKKRKYTVSVPVLVTHHETDYLWKRALQKLTLGDLSSQELRVYKARLERHEDRLGEKSEASSEREKRLRK